MKGKAWYLLDALEPSARTFNVAIERLTKALASRPVQVGNVLSQLVEMKLTYTTEPFQYMGQMEKLKQQTTALDIKIDEILPQITSAEVIGRLVIVHFWRRSFSTS